MLLSSSRWLRSSIGEKNTEHSGSFSPQSKSDRRIIDTQCTAVQNKPSELEMLKEALETGNEGNAFVLVQYALGHTDDALLA